MQSTAYDLTGSGFLRTRHDGHSYYIHYAIVADDAGARRPRCIPLVERWDRFLEQCVPNQRPPLPNNRLQHDTADSYAQAFDDLVGGPTADDGIRTTAGVIPAPGIGGFPRVAIPQVGLTPSQRRAALLALLAALGCTLLTSDQADVQTRTRDRSPSQVIVELGAGDYRNAIAVKRANPHARVVATNALDEWTQGKLLHQVGLNDLTNSALRMYLGWIAAKHAGVDVGATQPYQNQDIPTGVADIVYTIAPYPSQASIFGSDAARIAKTTPWTLVAATGGISTSLDRFEMGFTTRRPGSQFINVNMTPFGMPHRDYERSPFTTRLHIVP